MRSLTSEEGISGVLSYGLYKMYKDRFKYKKVKLTNSTKIIDCEKYDNTVKIKYYDKKSDCNVKWDQWQRVCKKFNHRKMESILKGTIFNMPYRLGSIGVVQYKRKIRFDEEGKLRTEILPVDWNKTYLLWKRLYPECKTREDFKNIRNKKVVYYTNEHSDGRRFRFHWKKKYCNIKNISAYSLVIPLQYRNALARLIFENNNIQYCTKF